VGNSPWSFQKQPSQCHLGISSFRSYESIHFVVKPPFL
jgi:hypothetical protein